MATLELTASTYEEHRVYVLAVLARRCGWLDRDEREAVFHDAYAVLLEKARDGRLDIRPMRPEQLRAYVTQTAINKALDEGKRAERKRSESIGERALAEPDTAASPEDLAAANMDNARLREIVLELPRRRQTIVRLRFFFERTPDEIQQLLGISERAYRRELERALRHIAERYQLVREGSFCDSRRSLILAYVAGIAGPTRVAEAREHLATCPACAHWAAQAREATRRAAALVPLPPIAFGGLPRFAEAVTAARDAAAQLAGAIKQHGVTAASRLDPTQAGYASSIRPGPVAAAVAGCIALGGGATYCALEKVPDPVRSLITPIQAVERSNEDPREGQQTDAATPATPPEPVPAAESAPATTPAPQPTASPAPERDFTLEDSGEPATPATSPPSAAPTASAAGSGQGGEEFGGGGSAGGGASGSGSASSATSQEFGP